MLTGVEILGLVLVIWFGRKVFRASMLNVCSPSIRQSDSAVLLAGAFLAFYAFIGFEDMVNVAEETTNPRRTMPLAILFALLARPSCICSSSSSRRPWFARRTGRWRAPLTLVFERSGARHGVLLSLIGMTAAMNRRHRS